MKHSTPKLVKCNKINGKGKNYSYKHIRKSERSQINNLILQLKEPEYEEEKPKPEQGRKEVIRLGER